MNKQIITALLLSLTSPTLLQAQSKQPALSIKGILCDSTSLAPEAYATVRMLQGEEKKPIKVTTTAADGTFSITAPKKGNYTIEFVTLGKQPVRRQITLNDETPTVNLDTLYIREYNTTLGTATITAQRPLVKAEIDKLTYSFADDPEAQTNTVLEMLRKVPMVTVDGEDNIKVNGKSGFKVYVNGKPNQMMSANPSLIFKSYPASSIQKIEVITNPGAKYDAEGVAGVLNIITKGNVNTSGYLITPNIGYTNRGLRGSLFAMAQWGKFTLSANYAVGKSKQPTITGRSEREIFDESTNHLYTRDTDTKNNGTFQFGELEASYEFSKKDLLSVSAGLHSWKATDNAFTQTGMFSTDGNSVYSYNSQTRAKSLYQGINTAVDFQHSFTEDRRLTLSYRYDYSPDNVKNETVNTDMYNLPDGFSLRDLYTDPDRLSYENTAQADFTTNIGKKHTLSVGLKYINRVNRSDSKEYGRPAGTDDDLTFDEESSLRYRHTSDIYAAYAEYMFKTGNWSIQAGDRYEYYHVRVKYPDGKRDAFSTHMNDNVPSISIGYNIKPTMLITAGYHTSIGRPNISSLSPYREMLTPERVSYGNPNLKSEKYNNFELAFNTFGPKLTFTGTLSYFVSNNGMEEYSFVENGVTNTTFGNFVHSKSVNIGAFINWTIVNGTRVNLNAGASYGNYSATEINARNSGWSGNCWGGINQDLPWNLKFGIYAGGNTKSPKLQGTSDGFWFYSLNLSRAFLKEDRLKVTLEGGNFIGRYHYFNNETRTDQFREAIHSRIDFMRFGVSVSYRLGNLKSSVKKAERSIENTDVRSNSKSGSTQSGGMQ